MGGRGQGAQSFPDANKEKIHSLGEAWAAELSGGSKRDTVNYTGSMYRALNKWLRHDRQNGVESIAYSQFTENIRNGLDKFVLPRGITVYRGANGKSMFGVSFKNFTPDVIKQKFKGMIVHDEGFGSAAIDKNHAWDKEVIYEIRIPKGKGRGAYVAPISQHPSEREFLIQQGSYYKVVDAKYDNTGNKVVTLDWIPASRVPKK